jgi:hypothetical protein
MGRTSLGRRRVNNQTPGQAGQYPDMSGLSGQGNPDREPDIRGALSRRESPRLSGLSGAPSFVRGPASKEATALSGTRLLGDATATEKRAPGCADGRI